jgi:hypothetical protein
MNKEQAEKLIQELERLPNEFWVLLKQKAWLKIELKRTEKQMKEILKKMEIKNG